MTAGRGAWLGHGFWNTLEHAVTRFADALTTMIVLWVIPPEIFSRLAIAQATVAPVLFFFLSPEAVIYRDYGKWKLSGTGELAARVRAFRLFGWAKAEAALAIAAGAAMFFPGEAGRDARFWTLIWAFSLALAPQIAGPDREFLRLSLRLRELGAITFYQKLVLLAGTAAVAVLVPAGPALIMPIALVAAFSALSTALISWWRACLVLQSFGALRDDLRGRTGPSPIATISEAVRTFSVWSHFSGVIANWVQTMDLFFIGVFGIPAREAGLYAAAHKIAGFSFALPSAPANLFSIWIGRRPEVADGEASEVKRLSFGLFGVCLLQAGVLVALGPWIISLFSHGRWNDAERALMYNWLCWLTGGGVIIASTYIASSWLVLRGWIVGLFFRIYIPWAFFCIFIYALAVWKGGLDGAAMCAVVASWGFFLLLLLFVKVTGVPVRNVK